MVLRVPLDGDGWRCKGYLGEEWRMRRAYAPDTGDLYGWHRATVPGSVVADLVRAGRVPDPTVDDNSLSCEWVAQRTWVYRRDVSVEAPLERRRVLLHLEGVDYAAEVFVNGVLVGASEGMFTAAELDVTGRVHPGANLISVVVAPAPDSQPQVGRTELVRNAKSRMTYGWDFCPRLVHLGVWDSVWLEVVDAVRIADVVVRPRLGDGRADVAWEAVVEGPASATVTVQATVLLDGGVVASSEPRSAPAGTGVSGTVAVEAPALWWPNGHGGQPLYELRVRATVADGRCDDRRVGFGIRSVQLVANASAPASARGYTFVVNGTRVYVRGWNWVPVDLHHGVEDPQRLTHLMELAAAAHVNLLRVWGGGLIEKQAFYDLCDRFGIMVWQEFPLSSSGMASQPSADPEYVAGMAAQAEGIVARRRNHPSLVLWCGGNELDDASGAPLDDAEPVVAALRDVVARLDPGRAWLPTSPTGPRGSFTLEAVEVEPDALHDVHGPWEHQGLEGQRTLYNRATSLLHSEFGVEGMTNLATLEAFVSPEHRWPADRSNRHWVHRGDWWINTPAVQEAFGGGIDDLATLQRASQLLQAEGLGYAVAANRRRQWRNSGSIPWQLNESFPNGFSTSAVDYCGRPKAAYYAVAAAYRPVHASAGFPTIAWGGAAQLRADLWVSTTTATLAGCRLEAALIDLGGGRLHQTSWPLPGAAAASRHIAAVEWSLRPVRSEVFWLDLRVTDGAGTVLSATRYLMTRTAHLAPLLQLPATTLTATDSGGTLAIRNAGGTVAVGVTAADGRPARAAGYARFSDGHFDLAPGEQRRIGVRWSATSDVGRRVAVRSWNSPEIVVA